jgi:hypothetical protein
MIHRIYEPPGDASDPGSLVMAGRREPAAPGGIVERPVPPLPVSHGFQIATTSRKSSPRTTTRRRRRAMLRPGPLAGLRGGGPARGAVWPGRAGVSSDVTVEAIVA